MRSQQSNTRFAMGQVIPIHGTRETNRRAELRQQRDTAPRLLEVAGLCANVLRANIDKLEQVLTALDGAINELPAGDGRRALLLTKNSIQFQLEDARSLLSDL